MHSKKILFVNSSHCGGAERMTILYAKILKRAGVECLLVTRFAPSQKEKATILNFIPDDMSHQEVICENRWHSVFRLYRIIKDWEPEIIYTSFFNNVIILSLLKITHLINAQLAFRCTNTPSLKGPSLRQKIKKWYRYADVVVAQTDEMAEELKSIANLPANKVVTINNPIDKDLISQKIKETFAYDHSYTNYLAVGRLHPQKNFCNLIEAFAIVRQKEINSRLYIVGNTNNKLETDKIKKLIHNKGIEESVFLEDFQTNPFKYMKGCDCLVLSSDCEGLPNVMLEAMYLGRPVAATTCIPYIAQVIHDGENGYTCPVRDSEALAEAMLKAKTLKNLPMFNDVNKSDEQVVRLFNSMLNIE